MKDTQKIIVIAEEYPVFISNIEKIIQEKPHLNICHKAYFGAQPNNTPDNQVNLQIIALEVSAKNNEGGKFAKQVKSLFPQTKVLLISIQQSELHQQEIPPIYALKNESIQELINAILSFRYFDELKRKNLIVPSQTTTNVSRLTKREIEVLKYIGQGMSTKEIGAQLHIASSTVETHRRNLIDKLGVKNSKGLIRYAVQNGY